MSSLSDAVILITGGMGGVGSALAAAARQRGMRVALIDHHPTARPGVEADLILLGVDLADPEAAADAVGQVHKVLGRLDVLVNVAGTFRMETIGEGSLATWELLFSVNVKTAVATTQAALPFLKADGGGAVINVGAASALDRAGAELGAYTATKAAVAKFTEALAAEAWADGVRVNAVLPTIIDTPANRTAMPNADPSVWVPLDALADAILFLASAEARAITGALLPVRGGV